VTGCSSGFGDLIARSLARQGHRVFASMRGVKAGNARAAQRLEAWADAEGGWVGGGPEQGRFEQLARDLGVDAEFRGALGRDEVAALLADASFLVSASRDENVAGIVTEAIASGTPVVSTRVGEPASYVTDEVGILVEPGDADDLARGIAALAARARTFDPEALHRHMAGLYGAETVRDQLLEVYREVLARRRDGRLP